MLTETSYLQKLKIFKKYFLQKSHESLVREPHLGLISQPVYPHELESQLSKYSADVEMRKVHSVNYENEEYPIWQLSRHSTQPNAKRILVISGVHGNETASITSIPTFLETNPTGDFDVVTPLNPVGAAYESRYNESGLDINYDFGTFETPEARTARDVIADVKPDFILNLHEGPQEGAFVIANSSFPDNTLNELIEKLEQHNVPLAERSFLGNSLKNPGIMKYGPVARFTRNVMKLHTVGYYADTMKIPSVSFESPWHLPDIDERISMQVTFLQSAMFIINKLDSHGN